MILNTNNRTSCSGGAVPIRCARTITGITARDAGRTAVVQVAEDPGGPHPRGRGFAVEASSNTPYNPYYFIFCICSL